MRVIIGQRTQTGRIKIPEVDLVPVRYSHAAIGGPKIAEIKVKGDDIALWSFLDKLRCPVTIQSDQAEDLWWGFLNEAQVTAASAFSEKKVRVKAGMALDTMFSRVAVAYTELTTKKRQTTAWVDELTSQGEYGVKECLYTLDQVTAAFAEAKRDEKLEQVKFPQLTLDGAEDEESSATLYCRGWWDTLGWLYYANASMAEVDTAEQIAAILDAKGQMFFDVINELLTSGWETPEFCDGDGSALYEATRLMEIGTTNFRRILVRVDPARRAWIYEEPAMGEKVYKVGADMSFEAPEGGPIRNELCPAGVWARWKDVIPPSVNVTALNGPSQFFVEENEYDVEADRLTPLQRGKRDPLNAFGVQDG